MKNLITSLVGFSPAITRNLNGPTRIRLFIAALAVFFVASVSSLLFANTFANLCFNGRYFWPLFVAWFGFTWLLDSVVLMSGSARGVFFGRLGICLLLGLLNSFTADVRLFQKDIHNYLTTNYNAEVNQLDSSFAGGFTALDGSIARLEQRNSALLDSIKASSDRLFREYNGQEGTRPGDGERYYFKLESFHRPDSLRKTTEIANNLGIIADLKEQRRTLEGQRTERRSRMVLPESAGLRDNVNAMHEMVWGPAGTLSDRIYFVLFFLLGFVLEAMVLVVKGAAHRSIDAYESIASSMSEATKEGIINRHNQEEEVRAAEANGRHQVTMNRITEEFMHEAYRSRQTIAVDEIEGKIHQAVKEEEAIHAAVIHAQRRNERMKEEMGSAYEDFGQDLYDRTLAVIRKELDRMAANSKRPTKEPA